VLIRDLGAVRIYLGERLLGRNTRRKVIGLLCYVSSRPGMAATRDEVLEALWADLGPDTAGNSLHQTIYFLRRLLEADFKEGMSAGYVHFDGEVLALDEGLVQTDSRECWRLIAEARTGHDEALDRLVRLYRGTYALDFAYEDWTSTYRDNLHAAVLSSVEAGVRHAVSRGDLERGIRLAQGLLAVDPTADAVELELLRAYKAGGRHAAAAEQYGHYASYVRGELGVEPPSYGDI
jgi:DNA-binding SARP family transcriptional activator